jgi:predicted SAM-dependent methyltransferase
MSSIRMLNVGCGSVFHPDWENIDIVPFNESVRQVDAAEGLPYQSGAFDFVYASHVLEHIAPHQVGDFLGEIRRVLAEDGIARLVVPDLEQIAATYLQALQDAKSGSRAAKLKHLWMTVELVDQMARQYPDGGEMIRFLLRHGEEGFRIAEERLGYEISNAPMQDGKQTKKQWLTAAASDPLFANEHLFKRRAAMTKQQIGEFRSSGEVHLWMYDAVSLEALLQKHGFQQPEVMGADGSGLPAFTSYELDTLPDGNARKPDSLYMEARKA